MSSLAERLRGIVQPHETARPTAAEVPTPDQAEAAADVLGGQWFEHGAHRFLIVDRSYAPGHRHGSMSIGDALPSGSGWSRFSLLGGHDDGTPLFVDLETTGLAGGAGTYAFLVGCGWFDRGRFRLRQFFLSSFSAERALLEALTDVARRASTLVTYNGKTFDLPLIETRYALHRLGTPLTDLPHVDMLHHARRLWRDREDGHRLGALEGSVLGHDREGDVPGFDIPARYFRYVHTGDARPLEAVLEHNRQDLISLALLTARAAQLLDEGAAGASTGSEALGVGRLFERSGQCDEALACFRRAEELGSVEVRADALKAAAVLLRRLRRYEQAAEAWQRLLDMEKCPSHLGREAAEALAIHHEHRLRNLLSARRLAVRSLHGETGHARRQATEHRLARLDRKLSEAGIDRPALF
jgi:hypothetical protein